IGNALCQFSEKLPGRSCQSNFPIPVACVESVVNGVLNAPTSFTACHKIRQSNAVVNPNTS
ncbi:MAG: hypothetical protein RW306_05430, partial [Geobacteraceae bacterium]|nr:hypothetical protein [Geobacteraceae bacterium]